MRYQWHGETLLTDLLSALTAMAYGGARAVYAISNAANKDKQKLGVLTDVVAGAGGLIAKNYVGGALAHEVLEALGYAGFANLGQFAAAVYKKANNIPVWRPESAAASARVVYYQPPVQYYGPAPGAPSPNAPPESGSTSILEI